jgi:hypothetical protein
VEVGGWQERGHGGMVAVRGIVCHHTAGAPTGDFPSLAVVRDGRADLPGPLSALGLGRSGTVYVIAAGLSWHAGDGSWPGLNGNGDCLGIEAESVGDGHDWTAAQRDAYPRLCAALCRHYGIPASLVIAHREWTDRKIDPLGIDMDDLRGTVARLLDGDEDDMTPEQAAALDRIDKAIAGAVGPGQRDFAGTIGATLASVQSVYNRINAVAAAVAAVDTDQDALTLMVQDALDGLPPGAGADAIAEAVAAKLAERLSA